MNKFLAYLLASVVGVFVVFSLMDGEYSGNGLFFPVEFKNETYVQIYPIEFFSSTQESDHTKTPSIQDGLCSADYAEPDYYGLPFVALAKANPYGCMSGVAWHMAVTGAILNLVIYGSLAFVAYKIVKFINAKPPTSKAK